MNNTDFNMMTYAPRSKTRINPTKCILPLITLLLCLTVAMLSYQPGTAHSAAASDCTYAYQGMLLQDVPIAIDDDQLGTITRTFDYYVPPGLYPPNPANQIPLVFVLHGYMLSADYIFGTAGIATMAYPWCRMMEQADLNRFIVCAPDGWPGPTGQRGWNDCQQGDLLRHPQTNDVLFISELIKWFSVNGYNIDANRIYASGMSNGGGMALRLACQLGGQIAAAAAVCSSIPQQFDSECYAPTQKAGILLMNGTQDPYVPYDVIKRASDCWIEHNGLSGIQPIYVVMPNSPVPEETWVDVWADLVAYVDPQSLEGTKVFQYTVYEGGHVEPSITEQYTEWYEHRMFRFGSQCQDFEVSTEVWNFFKDQTVGEERVYRPLYAEVANGTGQGSMYDMWLGKDQGDERAYIVNAGDGLALLLAAFTVPDPQDLAALRIRAVCQDSGASARSVYVWSFAATSPGWQLVGSQPAGAADPIVQGSLASNLSDIKDANGTVVVAVAGGYPGAQPHVLSIDFLELGVTPAK